MTDQSSADLPERPRPATGWAIGGGVVAASPVAAGFGLGLPFGHVLALSLGLLAAGLIVALTGRVKRLEGRVLKPFLAAALLIPGGLIALEGDRITPFHVVPQSPVDLAALQQPLLVLPAGKFAGGLTDGFPAIAEDLRSAVRTFPDAASIAFLRSRGIRTVVAPGDLYRHEIIAPETSMRQVPGAVIFTLS